MSAAQPVNWGLKPGKDGGLPVANPQGVELLKKYGGCYLGDTAKKEVFLTFDLGYEAGFTAEVLDILQKHNIRAIFFLCGHYLNEGELVARMIGEGHAIGNHTDKHRDLPTLDEAGIRKDIVDFNTKFNAKYSATIKHFRPGKGRFDERTLRIAREEGLKTVMWSNAIVDWGKAPIDATASSAKVISRVHPGAIMLFHISNSGMPRMLEIMIPQLLELGYTFGDAGGL